MHFSTELKNCYVTHFYMTLFIGFLRLERQFCVTLDAEN